MDMEMIRPHSMRARTLEMTGQEHSALIVEFCYHLFRHLNDPTIQTRYLMLMNVALEQDIHHAYQHDHNLDNFSFNNNNNNNTTTGGAGGGAAGGGGGETKSDISSNSTGGSLFTSLLSNIVNTKVVQDAVVNSFREVMGSLFAKSMSLQDVQIVNNIVEGSHPFSQQPHLRPFLHCANPVHPLELNPEPLLVAESLIGSLGSGSNSSQVDQGRFLQNLKLYQESQQNDKELYNTVRFHF